jgi:tetratricopeptide (TPR) repeat protein
MKYILILFLFTANTLLFAGNRQQIADSLRSMVIDEPDAVERQVEKHLKEALAAGDTYIYARLLDIRGLAKRNLGKYAEAINDHKAAYDLHSKMNNRRGMAGSLNSIAIIMIRTNKFDEALKYLDDALKSTEPSDSGMLNSIYINKGVCYDYTDRPELAIETYKTALPYVIGMKDDYGIGVVLHDIAVCYGVLKKYEEAENYEFEALKYQERSGNKDLLARIYISLGSYSLEQRKMEAALQYFTKGAAAAEDIRSVELQEECMAHLIEFYIRKPDPDKALQYIEKLELLKEEVYSSENSKHIAEAETRFNVALKNKEIENLKISKNLAELQAERSKLIRNVMAVIVLLVLVVFIFIVRNYQLRKKNLSLVTREKELIEKEKKMLEQNNELLQNENMLARFEILKSQVSPHFLFNTLNALSYLIESDSEKAMQFTTAFSKLYRTILELKDKNLITLQEELAHVESYFFLQLTRFGSSLRIASDIPLEVRMLKLPPFSIQICIENAINHNVVSEKYPLEIRIYAENKFLVIENNLREKAKSFKSTSIGIANIRSRYSFFTSLAPQFIKESDRFIVKLPLLDAATDA